GADSCAAITGGRALNVFQGQQLQNNAVIFRHVPIDPPGPGKTRRLRITNLRTDATKIPEKQLPKVVFITAQIFDREGSTVPVQNPEFSALVKPGVTISIRTPDDQAIATGSPALSVTPVMIAQNNPGPSMGFNVKFSEGFPGAFKRRNSGTS